MFWVNEHIKDCIMTEREKRIKELRAELKLLEKDPTKLPRI